MPRCVVPSVSATSIVPRGPLRIVASAGVSQRGQKLLRLDDRRRHLQRGVDRSVMRRVRLQADELGVVAIEREQLFVAALLDQLAAVEDEDAVGVAEGREPVGDGDGGAAAGQGLEGLLNRLFAFGVDVAGGLVEDQDRRIVEDRPGDREALPFAAGETRAALAEPGVVAERRVEDELVGLGRFGGGDRLLGRAGGQAVNQIVPDRAAEQERLLQHDADLLAELLRRELAYVNAVDQHAAFVHVVETAEQVDQRRLAAAAAADDADRFARLDGKVDVVEAPVGAARSRR